MTRALLFDMDGVLVDTEPHHEEARQRIYRKYGIPREKIAGIPVQGRNTKDIFAEVHRRAPFPIPLAQAVAEKRSLFVSLIQGPVSLLPGVKPLLDRYRGHLKLALVSASARSNVETVLQSTGLVTYFDSLVCEEDVKVFKPDPEGYLLAVRRFSVAPADCIAFEDSKVGVAAAKAAGVRVVGVAPPGGDDLSAADLVVQNLLIGAQAVERLIGV